MKNGQFRFIITASFDSRRKRLFYLIPVFLCAAAIGYLIEQKTYETQSSRRNIKLIPIQTWEQLNLLNLKKFSWIMVNKSRCIINPVYPKHTKLLPVLVHSSRDHLSERLVIRKSWGSVPLYKKWDVRLVFLLGEQGHSENPDIKEMLIDEQNMYGDLVVGNFEDSFGNLSYKHIMGYKWVLNFCKRATFVLKVDDNIFIDILKWLDWRSEELEQEKYSLKKISDLYCYLYEGTKPIRNSGNKWYVSMKDWSNEYYPDYCSGAGYGTTVNLIKKIYSALQEVEPFQIDDVFVTGVLIDYLKKTSGWTWAPMYKYLSGQVTTDIREFREFCEYEDLNEKREFRMMAYVPRGKLFERDMMCMWNKTLHDKLFKWSDW